MAERLDITKIRRSWELLGTRAAPPPPAARPAAAAAAPAAPEPPPPPVDPLAMARDDLARIRELLQSQFSEHLALLGPFVRRIEEAHGQLEAAVGQGGDLEPLREEFDDSLRDLEDLLEVFLLTSQPR